MSDITIGRYRNPDSVGFTGWIEGSDTTGNRWITYLDPTGAPALHWGRRESDGTVTGEPIDLAYVAEV